MTDPAFIISFAVLFIFCIYLGFSIGSWAGKRAVTTREFWTYNIIAVVACVVATVLVSWLPLLYAAPLGLLGGTIAGLKMGFGESVGPWRAHDRIFNVNKSHRETAERGGGAERRRRTREGKPAPDLISVEGEAPEASEPSRRNNHKKR